MNRLTQGGVTNCRMRTEMVQRIDLRQSITHRVARTAINEGRGAACVAQCEKIAA